MRTIAIDLGGTIIKLALLVDGSVVDIIFMDADSKSGLKYTLPLLETQINNILHLNKIDGSDLDGIGLAFPGLVDYQRGKVISTNQKYDDALQMDISLWFTQKWNVPFFMDNDSRLATIGEWKYGLGLQFSNIVMMTIGTGIGTGVVFEGEIIRGKHFQAGSLGGHFIVDYNGPLCSCGNRGCVESLSSSFFLPTIITNNTKLSVEFRQLTSGMDFKQLFSLASARNNDAIIIRDHCLKVWSAAVVNYIHAYDPELVIIGGGVMNSKDIILPYIQQYVKDFAWCPSHKVKIVSSILGDDAALLGIEHCLLNLLNEKNAIIL